MGNFAIGTIINVSNKKKLGAVKNALLDLIGTLESDSEDKLFVYSKDLSVVPRSLGESVSQVANYFNNEVASVDSSLNCIVVLLNEFSYNYNKHVLYFTDQYLKSEERRIQRVVDQSFGYDFGIKFSVFNVGDNSIKVNNAVCFNEVSSKLINDVVNGNFVDEK